MRIQFVRDNYADMVELEVNKVPTEEEANKIYDDIYASMEQYEENGGDMDDFDFWTCCRNAASKHIQIVSNPVVKTFYLF